MPKKAKCLKWQPQHKNLFPNPLQTKLFKHPLKKIMDKYTGHSFRLRRCYSVTRFPCRYSTDLRFSNRAEQSRRTHRPYTGYHPCCQTGHSSWRKEGSTGWARWPSWPRRTARRLWQSGRLRLWPRCSLKKKIWLEMLDLVEMLFLFRNSSFG